jgi:sorbitol-specific phosphotransferase system component IIA
MCRASGDHHDDGDDLRLALRAATEHELGAVLAALGLTELGHVRIAGESAFASARPGRLELRLSDPDEPYEVSARAVASAVAIEAALGALTSSVIDPPLDDPHCVCPKYYPHLWAP